MKIAAEMRLKHGRLYELCKQMGGTRFVAEAIGIGKQTVHAWLHMRRCPTPGVYTQWYTEEVEQRLEELAGCPAAELFPRELSEATKFFSDNKVHVAIKDIEPAELLSLAVQSGERLVAPDPVDEASRGELKDLLSKASKSLSQRERMVIRLRFESGMTLAETGKSIGVSQERVRQLEARAIRKLQSPRVATSLLDFAPPGTPDFEKLDGIFKSQQETTLAEKYSE